MGSLGNVICIGSVLWDVIGRTQDHPGVGGDVGGRIRRLPGGVAMNIAMTLARLDVTPVLLSAIGQDEEGDELILRAQKMGMTTGHVFRPRDLRTDIYMAIECGAQGLIAAIADAHSLEAAGTEILTPLADGRLGSKAAPYDGIIVLDGNLTEALLEDIAHRPEMARADLRVAPASPGKAARIAPLAQHNDAMAYVNLEEAGTICDTSFEASESAAVAMIELGFSRALVSAGARAASLAGQEGVITLDPPNVEVQRVTGAGDTLMAAHIAAELGGSTGADALTKALDETARYVSTNGDP